MKKFSVISLSGGMDSSTLLLKLLGEGNNVTAISFDYGQKHKIELQRAKELVEYLQLKKLPLIYKVIKLDGLSELLNSTLVEGNEDVPEGHYREKNMKQTVVPNRNKIFSSIVQAIALSIATRNNAKCTIALGIHAGDHDIYPDCRQIFRDADEAAFKLGNWDSHLVSTYTPYLYTDKYGILKDGLYWCKALNLDFNEVYKRTNTSYKPTPEGYSDYKSASSVERIEAFMKLGIPDPVIYADETGKVSWETVCNHVKKVLNS